MSAPPASASEELPAPKRPRIEGCEVTGNPVSETAAAVASSSKSERDLSVADLMAETECRLWSVRHQDEWDSAASAFRMWYEAPFSVLQRYLRRCQLRAPNSIITIELGAPIRLTEDVLQRSEQAARTFRDERRALIRCGFAEPGAVELPEKTTLHVLLNGRQLSPSLHELGPVL